MCNGFLELGWSMIFVVGIGWDRCVFGCVVFCFVIVIGCCWLVLLVYGEVCFEMMILFVIYVIVICC